MKIRALKSAFFLVVVFSVLALPTVVFCQEHHAQSAGRAPAGHEDDPLKEEMVKLDAVFREVVSGVSLGDGARVRRALETMHGAMEKTHEGVRHSTVQIPKNPDRVKEFVELDRKFHAKLDTLATAAHKNDQQAMLKLTKGLLDGCVQCHSTFRNP
jgi:cytochrome c556